MVFFGKILWIRFYSCIKMLQSKNATKHDKRNNIARGSVSQQSDKTQWCVESLSLNSTRR